MRRLAVSSLAAAGLLAGARPASGEGRVDTAKMLLAKRSAAAVSVRAVLSLEIAMGGRSRTNEQTGTFTGVVVSPTGLVVTGSWLHLVHTFESQTSGASLKVVPKEVHVVLGSDTSKEEDAVFVAHDTTTGLAYLQLLDLGDRRLEFVDPAATPGPITIGSDLYFVDREERAFDFAPRVTRTYAAARITQPRVLWRMSEDGDPGAAAYDAAGALVGFFTMQFASTEDDAEASPESMLVPLVSVRAGIAQAQKRVPEAIERAREAKTSEPAPAPVERKPPEPSKPEEPKPPK